MESIRPKPWRAAYASERSVPAAMKSGGWGCWTLTGNTSYSPAIVAWKDGP